MRFSGVWGGLAAGALLMAAAPDARATDGHFLHGVGAINSAMGGAGVAASASLLGAFYVNPAGLIAFEGNHSELGFELFYPTRSLSSRMPTPGGTMSGRTKSGSEFSPVPAFGWSRAVIPNKLVIGVGGLGIGGFGVDYQVDPTNPILTPRTQGGFGQLYSNFQTMRIAPSVAYAISPKLAIGAALDVDWASLAVSPFPVAAPAYDAGTGTAFYSDASDADGTFGVGFQLGLQYKVADFLALGAAYTSPQWFQSFQYHAVYENPNITSGPTAYGMPRTIRFRMDMPAIYSAGVALTATPMILAAVDVKYYAYESTKGFDVSGYNADGSVRGFGWKNIWVVAVGGQYMPTDALAVRLGYNYSQNPIPDGLSMFNAPAPAVVQHHATVGLGYKLTSGLGIDLAYYRAFENSVSGPMVQPTGAVAGSNVKSTLSEDSFLVGFSFNPPRMF